MNMTTQEYETPAQKVISFFAEQLGVLPESVNLTSRLRQDLGLNGEEAADLLELYALSFDVDIDAFRINDYFGADAGMIPVLSYLLWIFGNGRPLKTLTIADLVRAFDSGKLEG